jgi:putative aminopeptidase FrvX
MNIKETFLNWTQHTTPYGKEDEYLKNLLPSFLKKDQFGNYYHIIGNSSTMFTAHLDTVGGDKKINHVIDEENGIIKTDEKSILGADDKTGVVILLYMIEHKVPGFYLFPVGEEVGCIGSGKLTNYMTKNSIQTTVKLNNIKSKLNIPKGIYNKIRKVISFDRMGYTSVITHQMDQRCCSNEFGNALSKELNKHGFEYTLDDSGVYSDSAEFAVIYPECTNLSVGYFAQHTNRETQDIEFLESLCDACVKINWENLPIYRNPNDVEFVDNYYNYWGGRGSGKNKSGYDKRHQYIFDDDFDESPADYLKDKENDVKTIFFHDKKYDFISDVSFIGDKLVDINLSGDRLDNEMNLIGDALKEFGISYDDLFWDGLVLVVENQKMETHFSRNELIEYIPELLLNNIEGYDDEEIEIENEKK